MKAQTQNITPQNSSLTEIEYEAVKAHFEGADVQVVDIRYGEMVTEVRVQSQDWGTIKNRWTWARIITDWDMNVKVEEIPPHWC